MLFISLSVKQNLDYAWFLRSHTSGKLKPFYSSEVLNRTLIMHGSLDFTPKVY